MKRYNTHSFLHFGCHSKSLHSKASPATILHQFWKRYKSQMQYCNSCIVSCLSRCFNSTIVDNIVTRCGREFTTAVVVVVVVVVGMPQYVCSRQIHDL